MATLAGDIGATKTILALYQGKKLLAKERYESKRYQKIESMLEHFLSIKKAKITSSCLGIPGPVLDNKCTATNIPWTVDAKELSKRFRIKKVRLMNDVEAMAYGIKLVKRQDIVQLNKAKPIKGTSAIIAIGTGLGEAIISDNSVIATEGGHSALCPRNDLEWQFRKWLQRKYGFADAESAVSGQGLQNIYAFLTESSGDENFALKEELMLKDRTEVIVRHGFAKTDRNCETALELFASFAASEAQNLALKSRALNGLYLAGGLPLRMFQKFREAKFLQAFASGRMHSLLEQMPVYVVLDEELGLKGALALALSSR